MYNVCSIKCVWCKEWEQPGMCWVIPRCLRCSGHSLSSSSGCCLQLLTVLCKEEHYTERKNFCTITFTMAVYCIICLLHFSK